MKHIREPKQLDTYLPAAEAAARLEQLAAHMRSARDPRLLVKWSINLSYWNPGWNEPGWTGEVIVRQIGYTSGPTKEGS